MYITKLKEDVLKTLKTYRFYLMVIMLIFTSAVVYLSNTARVIEGIVFIIYQVFAVYGIGYLIARLTNISFESEIKQFSVEYGIGYSVQIANWYICNIIFDYSIAREVLLTEILLLAGLFFLKVKKENTKHEINDNNSFIISERFWYVLLLFAIALFVLVRFFCIFGINYIPAGNIANNNIIANDLMWQINIAAFSKYSFPLDSVTWYSDKMAYHYYVYVANGMASLITGIPIAKIWICFSYIPEGIFFATSIASFILEVSGKMKMVILGTIIALFTSGVEYSASVTLSGHMAEIPLGIDMGIAFALLAFIVLIRCFQLGKNQLSMYLILLLFVAVSTGAKGPSGLIFVISSGIFCFCHFILNDRRSIIYYLGIVLSFGGVFLFVILGVGQSYGIIEATSRITENHMNLPLAAIKEYGISNVYNELTGYPEVMRLVALFFKYMLFSAPTVFMLILIALLVVIIKEHTISILQISMLLGYFSGYILACLSHERGHSEMYFPISSIILGIGFFCSIASKEECFKNNKYIATIILCIIIVGNVCFLVNRKESLVKGYNTIFNHAEIEAPIGDGRIYRRGLCRAYEWVQNNTSYDDVFITNAVLEDNSASFIMSALSERRFWLGCTVYTSDIYMEEVKRRKKLLTELYVNGNQNVLEQLKLDGVSYVMSVKGFDHSYDLNQLKSLEMMYENEDIQVARIIQY